MTKKNDEGVKMTRKRRNFARREEFLFAIVSFKLTYSRTDLCSEFLDPFRSIQNLGLKCVRLKSGALN